MRPDCNTNAILNREEFELKYRGRLQLTRGYTLNCNLYKRIFFICVLLQKYKINDPNELSKQPNISLNLQKNTLLSVTEVIHSNVYR
jgi:hypothetical protein